jgi:D-amino-acid oxidase
MLPGTEALMRATPDPWWASAVPDLVRTAPPTGYADAWGFTAPVVDMPVYLRWLRARLDELGATITRISLASLPQTADVVVSCAGLGSRRLAGDLDVRPVRGQVVIVSGLTLDRWWLDAAGPTYLLPRADTVVVGGTSEDGEWSRTPSPETAAAILARAAALVPEVAEARVVGHRVGLRPVRSEVRLEAVGRVVHCYGHGGSGVTVSWGCADEVTALVEGL